MSARTPEAAVRARDVELRQVEWLWRPFIPLGKLTALAGQMGQAKSLFTVQLAAAVTRVDSTSPGAPATCLCLAPRTIPRTRPYRGSWRPERTSTA